MPRPSRARVVRVVIRELADMPLPAQQGQVKVVIRAEQRIDAAAIRRVGVKDPVAFTQEDAHPVRVPPGPDVAGMQMGQVTDVVGTAPSPGRSTNSLGDARKCPRRRHRGRAAVRRMTPEFRSGPPFGSLRRSCGGGLHWVSPGCRAQTKTEWVVVMGRCLVVANRTLLGAELRDELRKRIEAGSSSFYVLVPNTSAADYQVVPDASGVLPPSLAWWATNYRGPATDEEASAEARQRLSLMLADLAALGVAVEGDLGSSQPLEAMEKVLIEHQFDEIIVATLPRRLSRWLRADLPRQAERRFRLPVTTIITKR
jgi:hypothetical protein